MFSVNAYHVTHPCCYPQANAYLQIKISQIEQSKQQVRDRLVDSVTQEVIKFDERRVQAETATIKPSPKKRQPRVAGQDKDKIFIAPDFNDPLPEDILDGFTH